MCSLYLGENLISGNKPINLGVRNIGEIVASSLPLTDAGLHLLDGSLILRGGIYQGFVDYIADLYEDTKVYNPDAFTIVGSPTITGDGIASGFSTSDYLTGSFTAITPSKIIFRTKGVYSSTPNTANGSQTIGKIQGTNSSPSIEYNPNANRLAAVRFHNNSSTDNFSANIIVPLNDGDIVEAEVIATSTSVTLNAKINGVPYTNTWSGNGLYCGAINGCTISNNSNWYWTGSIDLKQFSITVDGVEVFSGSNPANYFIDETTWQNSVTAYGVCGKFVYDSVNNTVRLPKVTGIIEGTTDVSALGDLVEAGLPNITGSFGSGWEAIVNTDTGNISANGLFANSTGSVYGYHGFTQYDGRMMSIKADASLSNSIYGNSSTVQPQTIKAFYYIVIANSTKTEIQSDIDEIATDLNGKADVDLSNINASQGAKNTIIGWGMPDYANKVSFSNDTKIQLPVDALVSVCNFGNNGSGWYGADLWIYDTDGTTEIWYSGNTATWASSVNVYVPKGLYVKAMIYGSYQYRFYIPLKGAN